MAVPGTSQASQRSTLVTVLAWVTMVSSGLLLPISFISLLMLLAGSDGSGNATLGGVFTVVLLPPFAFVAGIGLLLRQRWAWLFLLVLLTALLMVQVVELATPPGPPVTTVAPDGLRTTTFSSGDPLALPLAFACALGLLALLPPGVRRDCRASLDSARHGLRDAFRSAARGRNTAEPERPDSGAGRSAGQDGWRVSHEGRDATTREGMGALALVVVLLLVLTGVTTWLVLQGIQTGETWQPGARASLWHQVARADAPLSFWASLAIYAAVGIASLVFALLGARAMFTGRTQR